MSETRSDSRKGKDAPRAMRPRAIGDLLPDIGRASFRRFGFVQSSVVSRWPEIVGERYAEVSAPEAIRFPHGRRSNGVLQLTVSGAHATMMQHVEPAIIDRVNRFFGYPAVARIAIRQGQVAPLEQRETRVKRQLRVVPETSESLREIEDPELRACLEGLAGALSADKGDAGERDESSATKLKIRRLGDFAAKDVNGVSE
ncbi:MAG: DUF721 domain-containing protein [Parasphingopyxis sp.]|nr:DciA family protein [Sphingomonadales bacterium]